MDVQTAAIQDAEKILELQKIAYQREADLYHDNKIPPLTQTLEQIRSDFKSQVFLKAVDQNRIVGSVRARDDGRTCYIGRLIVHPDRQGNGIGTRLMAQIEKRFQSVERFELFTGTKSSGNIRLYERLGYRPFKEESVHPGLTLVFLEKRVEGV